MSGVTGAVVGGALVTAGASVYSSRQASNATSGAAGTATAENSRQFDTIRADTAQQRALGQGATGLLGRLYGISTQGVTAGSPEGNYEIRPGEVPRVNSALYASDPAYRSAWDQVLADQRKVDPNGFYYRASEHDAARVTGDLARYAQEYRAANPQAAGTQGTSGTPDMTAFTESPDYQFNLAEGRKAIDRSLLARGRGLSGAGVKEGTRYASGLASQEFGNYFNRLSTLAGLGSAATNTSAQAGLTTASNNSNIITNAGNTRASAYMQGAAGVNNSVQSGLGNYMLLNYLNRPVS